MMKRIFDILVSFFILFLSSPFLLAALLLVWLEDFHNPIYAAKRVGINGTNFTMYKIRSMSINAEKSGVSSTSNNDSRITRVGFFIRKFKLDELAQFINVLNGTMSIVGPRPNVVSEVFQYTPNERLILKVKPGITDISSIIFSDEGDILADSEDPDLDYNLLIRPWKSRFCLFYIYHSNFILDLKLVCLTALSILSKRHALILLRRLLFKLQAPEQLISIASRSKPLIPSSPP